MKSVALVLTAGLLMHFSASAQWSAGAYLGTLIDDNAFNNHLQSSDRVTELSLQTAYDWQTEADDLQLFYTGVGNAFAILPSRSFYEHNAGAAYSHLFGEDEATLLNAGGAFSLRDNRDAYTAYNHSLWSFNVNCRQYLSELFVVKAGYSYRSVSFAELSDFNYSEHVVFAHGAASLPTRTTIMLQADLDIKKYRTANVDTLSGSLAGSAMGKRRGSLSTPGVTQLISTLKIGQGIGVGTGLSVTGQYQMSLQKEARYLTFSDGRLTDDELFDDHYGYEGPMGSIMVTQLLPAGTRLRISETLQQRQYSDRPAFDPGGLQVAPQRIDNRSTFSLSVEKPFESLGIHVTLTYDHIINASNDSFYDYRNNALAVRVSFAY